jgi:hypothetical protein
LLEVENNFISVKPFTHLGHNWGSLGRGDCHRACRDQLVWNVQEPEQAGNAPIEL